MSALGVGLRTRGSQVPAIQLVVVVTGLLLGVPTAAGAKTAARVRTAAAKRGNTASSQAPRLRGAPSPGPSADGRYQELMTMITAPSPPLCEATPRVVATMPSTTAVAVTVSPLRTRGASADVSSRNGPAGVDIADHRAADEIRAREQRTQRNRARIAVDLDPGPRARIVLPCTRGRARREREDPRASASRDRRSDPVTCTAVRGRRTGRERSGPGCPTGHSAPAWPPHQRDLASHLDT